VISESLAKRVRTRYEVDEHGCWIWTGHRNPNGYGMISTTREQGPMWAHRAAYWVLVGEIPEGAHVLHKCDVPACINPDHLYLGDQAQNSRDAVERERFNKKLNWAKVREIRALLDEGVLSKRAIGRLFGVSGVMIGYIARGEQWKDRP
jgi:hypothetical protein